MKILKVLEATVVLGAAFASGYVMRATTPTKATSARRVLYYVDPMHPAYTSDKPGVAPDCGMPLVPVYANEHGAASGAVDGNPEDLPPDAIRIPPERQQLIGMTYGVVERGGGTRIIRSVGKIAVDETRVGHVHTRVDGWIGRVFANFTGAEVSNGQPMLTIYSPDMLAAEQELLLARRERDLMKANPLASAAEHADALFDAAQQRLRLWDLSDEQIQRVLGTGEPVRDVIVRAPMSGFVTARNAFPNQRITPETELYTITDLRRVWIVANVFESDIASIRIGSVARVTFDGGSAPPITAKVTYVQPEVDPATRTLQVRLDAANPGTRMKPDMFVNVEFSASVPAQLTAPADAVVDTGEHHTVFVDLGNGYVAPREVGIGERVGDRIAITSGLSAGQRIVTSGSFLVDSESRLKSAARRDRD